MVSRTRAWASAVWVAWEAWVVEDSARTPTAAWAPWAAAWEETLYAVSYPHLQARTKRIA